MEITSLPLSPTLRAKLLSAGYTSIASLASVSHSQLARDLNISDHDAVEIFKVISQYTISDRLDGSHSILAGARTAWDKLHEEQNLTHITTSCEDLDVILGGGINCKEITEIGGVPGIGKTQLGIQLAVNVQIPNDFGGLGGKAIYIDTEGSFMVERAFQIAEACIQDTLDNFVFHKKDFEAYQEKMQPKAFLENIFYFRICSHTEQVAVINYLDKFIEEHKDVKLVVIDSITFHFRQEFEDLALRTRLLGGMALKLMKLAQKYCLAVVLLNQVTTKITEVSFQLTLALGVYLSKSLQLVACLCRSSCLAVGQGAKSQVKKFFSRVTVGLMLVQIGLSYTGMAMNDMHTSTNPPLCLQHRRPFL